LQQQQEQPPPKQKQEQQEQQEQQRGFSATHWDDLLQPASAPSAAAATATAAHGLGGWAEVGERVELGAAERALAALELNATAATGALPSLDELCGALGVDPADLLPSNHPAVLGAPLVEARGRGRSRSRGRGREADKRVLLRRRTSRSSRSQTTRARTLSGSSAALSGLSGSSGRTSHSPNSSSNSNSNSGSSSASYTSELIRAALSALAQEEAGSVIKGEGSGDQAARNYLDHSDASGRRSRRIGRTGRTGHTGSQQESALVSAPPESSGASTRRLFRSRAQSASARPCPLGMAAQLQSLVARHGAGLDACRVGTHVGADLEALLTDAVAGHFLAEGLRRSKTAREGRGGPARQGQSREGRGGTARRCNRSRR
jgi:hypothetical protein